MTTLLAVKPSPKLSGWFLAANRFLNGRSLEVYLASGKTLIGLCLLPSQAIDHQFFVLQDLMWLNSNWFVALPFLALGIGQMVGAVADYNRCQWSWWLRAACAVAGEFLWLAILFRHFQLMQITTLLPFAIPAILANFWIWWKALNGLPLPSDPGQLV